MSMRKYSSSVSPNVNEEKRYVEKKQGRSLGKDTRKVSFDRLPVSSKEQKHDAKRKRSKIGRASFLQSFGKDILFGYTGYEHDKKEDYRTVNSEFTKLPNSQLIDTARPTHVRGNECFENDNASVTRKRLTRKSAKLRAEKQEENVLSMRGADYVENGSNKLYVVERLLQQSARRRMLRILKDERERVEKERVEKERLERTKEKNEIHQANSRLPFKRVAKGLMSWKIATGVKDIFNSRRARANERRKLVSRNNFSLSSNMLLLFQFLTTITITIITIILIIITLFFIPLAV